MATTESAPQIKLSCDTSDVTRQLRVVLNTPSFTAPGLISMVSKSLYKPAKWTSDKPYIQSENFMDKRRNWVIFQGLTF